MLTWRGFIEPRGVEEDEQAQEAVELWPPPREELGTDEQQEIHKSKACEALLSALVTDSENLPQGRLGWWRGGAAAPPCAPRRRPAAPHRVGRRATLVRCHYEM